MKFRFWNREDKHYTVNKEMSVTADGTVLFAGSEMLGEKYVAERFTGITDKNDTPIYEGDIVLFRAFTQERKEEVYFDYCGFYPFADIDPEDLFMDDVKYTGDYEVIGNIHENKELLEH